MFANNLVDKLAINSKGYGYINEDPKSDSSDSDNSVSESDGAVIGTKSKLISSLHSLFGNIIEIIII